MQDLWRDLVSSDLFMPHGHCYLWKPGLVWLQVLSNSVIGISYVAIASTLVILVRRVKSMPFHWMYLAFGTFIVACGITHFFDVWVIWRPTYWLDGGFRALTALASLGTALLLPPLLPKASLLASSAELAHERGLRLEQANRDMRRLLDQARDLERIKDDFFANVSHELRTPLALILGPTEKLLEEANASATHRPELEIIHRNARRLLKHVNDLLDVSKLNAGKMEVHYANVDVAALGRLCAGHFDALARSRSITFELDAPTAIRGQVDAEMVERALTNILANAFRFTPSGGRIRCSVTADDDRVQIAVSDSGPGIAPEHRVRVFERFRQIEGNADGRPVGTGLGLAIAKEVIELQRGRITVDQGPEGGARFVIELPSRAPQGASVVSAELPQITPAAAETARVMEAAEAQSRRTVPTAAPDERGLVLVVEDNAELQAWLADVLAGEFRVATANNGAEALVKMRAEAPDVVVTDIAMPTMSGDELVRMIRTETSWDAIPVVVLTARADDDLRVRLLGEGAQDYLMKPCAAAEVRVRVSNQATMKRTREALQTDLASVTEDLEELAREVKLRRQELNAALDAARSARERAEQLSRYKSDFLGLVSHELRTPLTSLRLQIDRLNQGLDQLPPRQASIVARMDISCRRLTGLVESLLQYARLEHGRLEPEREPFSLSALVEAAADELRTHALEKGLSFEVAAEADPVINSDPRLWSLVVTNLVSNAIKFTVSGSVRIDVGNDAARGPFVSVRDSGPGIAPEDQARVFEPFEQLEAIAKKHTAGIGLGLAIVRKLVTVLGGDIEVESEPARGSTFRVYLAPGGAEAAAAADHRG